MRLILKVLILAMLCNLCITSLVFSAVNVNYDEYLYRDEGSMVTYSVDYMYVLSSYNSPELKPYIEPEQRQEMVKKPIISIMVSSINEVNDKKNNNKELPDKKAKETVEIKTNTEYKIYFDFNSYKVKGDQLALLKNIKTKGGEIASVYGYACPIGKTSYNKKLSERRAKEVAGYLQKQGIAIEKAVGMGETNEEEDLKLNRKVVIKIQ